MSTAPAAPPPDTPPPAPGPVDWSGATRLALGAAVVGFATYGIAGAINMGAARDTGTRDFLSAWLAGWVYWACVPIGAIALLMVHYLVKTSWGVLLKRSLEAATRTLPLIAVLFVPVAFGATLHGKADQLLFWWSDPPHAEVEKVPPPAKAPAGDAQLEAHESKLAQRREAAGQMIEHAVHEEREAAAQGNYNFLSAPVFIGLSVVYFVIWGVFAFFLNKWAQEIETDPTKVEANLVKCQNLSAPGLIVHGIVVTAASTHWVMSLQPGWASTMFPVIFNINAFLTTFALCVAIFLLLSGRPPFRDVVRPKFQLDMGSLMLAFTLFWSYTSFSQLMLIWIGNLPEEIPFFLKRSNDTGWWWVSAVLIVFHFALPFVLLLFRDIKLHPVRLRVMAVYLLIVCAVDVVWWVEPTFAHRDGLYILMDVGAILGIGGVWGLLFVSQLRKRPLLPMNELFWLPEGHHHEHH